MIRQREKIQPGDSTAQNDVQELKDFKAIQRHVVNTTPSFSSMWFEDIQIPLEIVQDGGAE